MEKDPAIRNPDYMAQAFVGSKMRSGLHFRRLTRMILQLKAPGYYYFQVVRTKHYDAVLLEQLRAGVSQVVLLGAGYDTRPYRFRDELSQVRVLELDFPSTQERKRERCRQERLAEPSPLHTYQPIDFNRQSIADRLVDSPYDPEARTLFIWEGVCMYLEANTVNAVLEFIRTKSGAGSSVAFDYVYRRALEGDRSAYGAAQSFKIAAESGEPYRFGLDPEEVEMYLQSRGLQVQSHLTGPELQRAYLGSSSKDYRVWEFMGVVVATT
jgi:methyltransferase (TIGR00027 family)